MNLCVKIDCKEAIEAINIGNNLDGICGNLVRLIKK